MPNIGRAGFRSSVRALPWRPGGVDGSIVIRRWARHPRTVGRARAELWKALGSWELADLQDGALLVLSELLSNAVLHAHVPKGREIETRFSREADGVRIEVHDAANTWPKRRMPLPDAEFGRGLTLVSSLSLEWGVSGRGGVGKSVWAVVTADSVGRWE